MAKSNFWSSVLIIGASVLLTLGILRGCSTEENQDPADDSVSTEVFTQGIQMKLLQTTENDDGSITKQFTYTITPAEATYQDVSVSASYIDSTDCSAVLTTSVDNSAKTIDVNCLAAFDKQINVVVQSVDNPDAKATVKVDYVKKILSIIKNANFTASSGVSGTYNPIGKGFVANYSIYTVDKNYTFAVRNFTYSGTKIPSTCSASFKNAMAEAIKTYINGGTFATEAELWQMATTNADKAWLLNNNSVVIGVQTATIYCVENEDVFDTLTGDNLYFTLNYSFTGYKVAVESISAETGSIEF